MSSWNSLVFGKSSFFMHVKKKNNIIKLNLSFGSLYGRCTVHSITHIIILNTFQDTKTSCLGSINDTVMYLSYPLLSEYDIV